MSIKLKALGLGLLAALAVSAVTVMNASAESQATGHFTCEVEPCTVKGEESGTHQLELGVPGLTGIVCDKASYSATAATKTVTDLTVTPTYAECHTTGTGTGSKPGEVIVDVNGCTYTFTQPNKEAAKTEHTVDLVCPTGKTIIVTHPECEITIDPINGLKGVGYTTILENNIHAITLTSNVSGFSATFHKGVCVLLGTNHTGTLSGSATVKGFNGSNEQKGITATGSVN